MTVGTSQGTHAPMSGTSVTDVPASDVSPSRVPPVTLEGVHFSYRGEEVLRGADLTVRG